MKSRAQLLVLCMVISAVGVSAEVVRVVITSKANVANGQPFGKTGPYEKLVGTVEFALDPASPRNAQIVDLKYAPRESDGRVHFTSDLYVLRPADATKGNGVLLFEVVNRGRKGVLRFNRAALVEDPSTPADFGDGFLMRDGYTLVFLGWEFNLDPPLMRADLPRAALPNGQPITDETSITIMVDKPASEVTLIDYPSGGRPPSRYPPANPSSPSDSLTVRDGPWDNSTPIPRARWRFTTAANEIPKILLDGGFEPGRLYELTYRAIGPRVTGAAFASFRDLASAFKYRTDLPIRGRAAYIQGESQSGRFLREFLYGGFNVDERGRKAFDAVWPNIAGAALGPFNGRFVITTHGGGFTATRFPFADAMQTDITRERDGLLTVYQAEHQPKVFHTNGSQEYWGGGRAAALTHTTPDGKRDIDLPPNVRIYLHAGTQHGPAPFPPVATHGQQLNNPTNWINARRALLRALHEWVTNGTAPPASKYPRLSDKTLVPASEIRFPAIPGVQDPRRITGPARLQDGKVIPLPHLVPEIDADGIELAGIRDPELLVPLATTTGWNFRAEAVGNTAALYPLLGSYLPFARTRAEREARGDPRLSVEERYPTREEYLRRITQAADELVRNRYLLQEDLEDVLTRAVKHWDYISRGAGE